MNCIQHRIKAKMHMGTIYMAVITLSVGYKLLGA